MANRVSMLKCIQQVLNDKNIQFEETKNPKGARIFIPSEFDGIIRQICVFVNDEIFTISIEFRNSKQGIFDLRAGYVAYACRLNSNIPFGCFKLAKNDFIFLEYTSVYSMLPKKHQKDLFLNIYQGILQLIDNSIKSGLDGTKNSSINDIIFYTGIKTMKEHYLDPEYHDFAQSNLLEKFLIVEKLDGGLNEALNIYKCIFQSPSKFYQRLLMLKNYNNIRFILDLFIEDIRLGSKFKLKFRKIPLDFLDIILYDNNPDKERISYNPFNIENVVDDKLENNEQSIVIFLVKVLKYIDTARIMQKKLNKIPIMEFDEPDLMKGKYLGHGGFGEVFKNKVYDIDVAVKLELEDRNSGSLEKLIKECTTMRALNHKNLLRAYGFVNFGGRAGIVMDYCEYGSLSDLIKNDTNLQRLNENIEQNSAERLEYDMLNDDNVTGRLKIFSDLASATNFMHFKKYIHFDIKPQNIFFSSKGMVLADFGLSVCFNNKKKIHCPGCSIYYSPSEQISNTNPDTSSDVWALGMVLYYLLIGKHPFLHLRNLFAVKDDKDKHIYKRLISIQLKRPIIPCEFESKYPVYASIMRMCWSIEKEKRCTVQEMLEAINHELKSVHQA